MRWISFFVKFALYGMITISLLITGCASQKLSKDAKLKDLSPQTAAEAAEKSGKAETVDLEKVIQQAESHYEQGYGYYKEHNWTLAEQEFDEALRTLLDADVDTETHYKLGKAYYKLFYNIRKLTLEQNYLTNTPSEQQASEQTPLDASAQQAPPEIAWLAKKPVEPAPAVNASIQIDETDADIQKYFAQLSSERSQYREGVARAAKYLPMMRQIFQANQLPVELIYLPLIESNFRVDAVSPAGAVGLWQFVRSTAKIYGLKVDKWVDERRDPKKATIAAAKYLKELYDMLGSWELVLAGYYMGEYRVHNAIGAHRTRNIATLSNTKAFGWGAKQYVARFKAAALLAKALEQDELADNPLVAIPYETVPVRNGARLQALAEKFGVTYAQLQESNPELKTATIPPGNGSYALKVPAGAGNGLVAENMASQAEQVAFQSEIEDVAENSKTSVREARKKESSGETYQVYQIKKRGETLTKIAERYGVTVETLEAFNHLKQKRAFRVGQKIKIPQPEVAAEIIGHVVQKGETLYTIAKHYKVDVATLKTYNNLKRGKSLHNGQTVKVPLARTSVVAKTQDKKVLTYRVKRGDSLSKIASSFGVSIGQLKEWNNFEGSMIYPGSRIKVWY